MHFDLTSTTVVEDLTRYTRGILAHEFNHAAREQLGKSGKRTKLNALIQEGLAVYYQEYLDGKHQEVFWGKPLTPTELDELWRLVQPNLSSTLSPEQWNRFFVGDNEVYQPIYAGYRLGNTIITEYMQRHPDMLMRDLVRKSSKQILQGSGLSNHQKPLWITKVFRRG